MIRATAAGLLAILLQVAGTSRAEPISLELDLTTIRKNAFPVATLRRDCAAVGVPESRSATTAYSVNIRYGEEKKGEYRLQDGARSPVTGTEITYEVAVTRLADATVVGRMSARFHPGQYLTLLLPRGAVASESDVYQYVSNSFRDSSEFRLTCSFVAAAQGSVPAYRRLLRWAVAQDRGLVAVRALGIHPRSDTEAAALRIAGREFDGDTAFTKEASEYLEAFVESHFRESEFGRASPNELDSDQRRGVRLLTVALRALINSNPQRSRSLLPSLLGDMDSTLSEGRSDRDVVALFTLVFESFRQLSLGCAQVGDTLKWIARRTDDVGKQAREFSAAMRCR